MKEGANQLYRQPQMTGQARDEEEYEWCVFWQFCCANNYNIMPANIDNTADEFLLSPLPRPEKKPTSYVEHIPC